MRSTPQDRVRCRLGWADNTATDRLHRHVVAGMRIVGRVDPAGMDRRDGSLPAVVPDQGCALQGDPQRYRAVTAARMVS